jgi:DNA-binding CsgD family transcriptional regulator
MVDVTLGLALRSAREAFLTSGDIAGCGGDIPAPVRAEIATSWRRSVLHGLRPDRLAVPYEGELDFSGRFADAARPVADRLSDDLADTGVTLLLADEQARLLDRRVTDLSQRVRLDTFLVAPGFQHSEEHAGTNAIGTALRQRSPVAVAGGEHFAETLTELACAAAPVTDPATGQVAGAIGLTCPAETASPLMLPLVKQAAREIEQRLAGAASAASRVLFASFVQARRRAKEPLVSVSHQTMHTTASAALILQPADQAILWSWASQALASYGPAASELQLSSGLLVVARAQPVYDGGVLAGPLVRIDRRATAPAESGPRRATVAPGWDSLTDTERGVAAVIGEGATNREAASRLYLSPHTIDYHLRQIFRKLGIGSRVELARIVMAAQAGPASRAG